MRREDDYQERRKHLADLSDEALYERFWELADQLVAPMLEAGRRYTSPAIERSVLLRMGFSSLEAKPMVAGLLERDLLGHGAGHAIYLLSKHLGLGIREAGLALLEGQHWDTLKGLFQEKGA